MKQAFLIRCVALAAVALTAAGCTMKDQDAPALTGPSEFGQSLTVSVTPDVLTQDGASQSVVTVLARGPNAAPLPNVSLRAEIQGGGGSLSSRNVVTDSNGRATLVYTAPAIPAGLVVYESSEIVNISVTPVGTDFGNATARMTTLRLLPPPGTVVVPPAVGLGAAFTFTPPSPLENQIVQFDAKDSTPAADSPITQYRWDFGDGGTGSGIIATHAYRAPGQYSVSLTVVDGLGRTRSTSRLVGVTAPESDPPMAVFNFSPTTPVGGQNVFFNASESTAAVGRHIVSYRWIFGDGTTSDEGPTTSKQFGNSGSVPITYRVTLTVTDDVGGSHTSSPQDVIVRPRP